MTVKGNQIQVNNNNNKILFRENQILARPIVIISKALIRGWNNNSLNKW